ncbi:hypothetical protein CDL12_15292 [Handroanthus impetiginosus]|uniref:Uncharacterized protein n=1 Tax=Handroanthus impetiginosus TaxID=429701 RepID=A0A2G9H3K1_9LAMI|nr:hypothetical protein CDL12_15292 [Handroanthus impetiginosus]
MERFLAKITASMATRGGSDFAEQYDAVDDDLSTWEFVNPSQSDDEDLYSFDSDDVTSEGGDVITDEPESKPVGEEEDDEEDAHEARGLGVLDAVISIQSLSVSPPMTFPVEMTSNHVYHDDGEGYDDGDGDSDDVYDMDDVDDELVPWKLKNRFGKQRIRKMGKRSGPKLNKSKKMPFYQNRPGCLHGKHGFGVQHTFI